MCYRLSYYFIHFSCFRQRSESFSSIRSHLHFRVNREVPQRQFTWKIYRSTFRWNEERERGRESKREENKSASCLWNPYHKWSGTFFTRQRKSKQSMCQHSTETIFIHLDKFECHVIHRQYQALVPFQQSPSQETERGKQNTQQLKSNRRSISLFSLLVFLLVSL